MANTAFNSPDLLANFQQNYNAQPQNQNLIISQNQITQMATALLLNQYNNSLNLFATNLSKIYINFLFNLKINFS